MLNARQRRDYCLSIGSRFGSFELFPFFFDSPLRSGGDFFSWRLFDDLSCLLALPFIYRVGYGRDRLVHFGLRFRLRRATHLLKSLFRFDDSGHRCRLSGFSLTNLTLERFHFSVELLILIHVTIGNRRLFERIARLTLLDRLVALLHCLLILLQIFRLLLLTLTQLLLRFGFNRLTLVTGLSIVTERAHELTERLLFPD